MLASHFHLGGVDRSYAIQANLLQQDLEVFRYGRKIGRPALSISKMKAAFYPDVSLEQLVPDQFWIEEECKYDIATMYGISHWWFQRQRFYIDRFSSEGDHRAVRTHMRILSVVRIEVFSMYGYNYMKKIILRRADLKEYVIAERDFKYMYPSDFEDLYLLNLQGHLNHLSPDDKKVLTTAINLWTRNLVIRQRVEDFQLGGIEVTGRQLIQRKIGVADDFEVQMEIHKDEYKILEKKKFVRSNEVMFAIQKGLRHDVSSGIWRALCVGRIENGNTTGCDLDESVGKTSDDQSYVELEIPVSSGVNQAPLLTLNVFQSKDTMTTEKPYTPLPLLDKYCHDQESVSIQRSVKKTVGTIKKKIYAQCLSLTHRRLKGACAVSADSTDRLSFRRAVAEKRGLCTGIGSKLVKNMKITNGGFVAFGSDPKGGKITGKGKIKTANLDFDDVYFVDELKFNLFSVSQMCDKKNSVLFTESECLILSPSFKLLDESQVVLRAPRKDGVYSLDLKNIVPSGGITCLYANATADESKLWHRRLGHVNFKNINKLVKGHLVRGLPSKVFVNDHTCVACKKGKQHKASCKAKLDRIIRKPLELLHMDLFGPVSIESINKKRYCLVVTDDFSRFSWVFFLATKDETSEILCNLIIGLEKQLNHNVKIIRCDNGTEFKNYVMNEFYAKKGIKREFSVARTP
ncbi:putative ribonuclease H-like domain-containing protein [Tanacetum coccineum]